MLGRGPTPSTHRSGALSPSAPNERARLPLSATGSIPRLNHSNAASQKNYSLTDLEPSCEASADRNDLVSSTWEYPTDTPTFDTGRRVSDDGLRRVTWIAGLLFCLAVWGAVAWVVAG